MDRAELEQLLRSDAGAPVPTAALAERVMEAVRLEASRPPPLAFPWRAAALGFGTALAGSAAALLLAQAAGPAPLAPDAARLAALGATLALSAVGARLLAVRAAT